MRVFVTGASGFSGRHMIRHLSSLPGERPEIFGGYRSSPHPPLDGAIPVEADLMSRDQTTRAVRDVAPDLVIHLAGLNRGSLQELLEVNVIGTEHLLDAVRDEAPCARTLVIGSSAEYGYAGEGPVPETAPLRPVGPYGISKAAEELLALKYHRVHNLSVAVAIPFNLVGPGLPESFVCSRIIGQAIEIMAGERCVIDLARVDSRRDFVDVRDAVAAYWQLLTIEGFDEQCAGKKFNIGSGADRSIEEVVNFVRQIIGDNYAVNLPAFSPPEHIPTQIADITRIHDLAGWTPRYTLERSIRDMLEVG